MESLNFISSTSLFLIFHRFPGALSVSGVLLRDLLQKTVKVVEPYRAGFNSTIEFLFRGNACGGGAVDQLTLQLILTRKLVLTSSIQLNNNSIWIGYVAECKTFEGVLK